MCRLGFVLVMAIEIPLCFPMVARDRMDILFWNGLKAVQMLPGLLFKCNELLVAISLWVSSCQLGGDIGILDINKRFPLTRDLRHVYLHLSVHPVALSSCNIQNLLLQGFGGWDFRARFIVFT